MNGNKSSSSNSSASSYEESSTSERGPSISDQSTTGSSEALIVKADEDPRHQHPCQREDSIVEAPDDPQHQHLRQRVQEEQLKGAAAAHPNRRSSLYLHGIFSYC